VRIAFYCTNEFPCPLPRKIVYAPMSLAEKVVKELERRGHNIVFYASSDSKIKVRKISCGMVSYYRLKDKAVSGGFHNQQQLTLYEQILASKMYEDSQKGRYDVIHVFHLAPKILPFVNLTKTPTVFTLHDPMSASWNRVIKHCRWKNKAYYVSISNNQRKGMPGLNYIQTVYNGIEIKEFKFRKKPGGYLAFLGRYSYEKGVDTAVKVARRAGEKLKLAGSVWGSGFYSKKVKPYLKSGKIENVGFLSRRKVVDFLAGAKALLFPIRWEEPFGLVMIEAMACGTPVIAFKKGSAGEVVKDGKTGFVVESEKEMVEAVRNINAINRLDCRRYVEENFTVEKMVDGYEQVYRKVILQSRKSRKK